MEQGPSSDNGALAMPSDEKHLVIVSSDPAVGTPESSDGFLLRSELDEHRGTSNDNKILPSRVKERYRWIAWGLALTDAVCICLALVVGWFLRWELRPMDLDYILVVLGIPLLWVAVFRAFGLYSPQHIPGATEFRRTIGATSLGILLVMVVSFWSKASFSRGWIAISWLIVLFLELTARHAWRVYESRLKRDGRLSYRTLVVGTNEEAARVADSLRSPDSGFAPLGYVSVTDSHVSENCLPVVGNLDSLSDAVRAHAADCLFVASTALNNDAMLLVATAARQENVEMRVSANLPEMLSSRLTVQPIGTSLALTVKPVRLSASQKLIKRSFDLTCGSLVLLLTMPLLAALAIAIRVSSSGPALFLQERVTQGGRSFILYKFRTMVNNAHLIRIEDSPDPSALFFKPKDDPRLTRVGRFLRSSSLDELPQLFNVIRGEMSLVGPRPLPVEQISANLELLRSRHEVPAGVTGWWQINGRSNLSAEEALRLDLFYIENWSLTLDLYIMLKTVQVLLTRRGAY